MEYIGSYRVPFPYPPYPLQVHAVTALRGFLSDCTDDTQDDAHSPSHFPTTSSAAVSRRRRVAVLESPTGTGKSHMLLGAVLSHFFAPVDADADADGDHAEGHAVGQGRSRGGVSEEVKEHGGTAEAPAVMSLSEALERQRVEEEVRVLRAERRQRVRAERRRLRHLQRKRKAEEGEGVDSFLLVQQSHGIEGQSAEGPPPKKQQPHSYNLTSSGGTFFSSSSSISSATDDSDDDDDMGDVADIAAAVPLRKPKIFFASRTHTQLQQLMADLQSTTFAQRPVKSVLEANLQGAARRLRAVHAAGRQHLCINAEIRMKSCGVATSLSDLCVEAMQFEYSAAGHTARRAQAKRRAAGISTSSAALDRGGGGVTDVEDLPGATRGCEYCAKHRLRALLTYLQMPPLCTGDRGGGTSRSLQEMLALGRELKACPYLTTRLLLRGADVVFIPYSYLVDEDQRNVLLGGEVTNAVSEAEADALPRECRATDGGDDMVVGSDAATHPETLGSVLYRRRREHQRGATTTSSSSSPPSSSTTAAREAAGRKDSNGHWRETNTEMLALAQSSPPNFNGDVVVIDEAHNIADFCRSVSNVTVTSTDLQLTQGMFRIYLARYEPRLLTKNKQRLRELIALLGKLIQHCATMRSTLSSGTTSSGVAGGSSAAGGRASSAVAAETGATTITSVASLSAFLFDADISHVDPYPHVMFLASTRLAVKLQGFVFYLLGLETPSPAEGGKRTDVSDGLRADAAAVRELLATLDMEATASRRGTGVSTVHTRYASIISGALRNFELFLRRLYESDEVSTRVLIGPAASSLSTSTSPPLGAATTMILRLVQLEPGRHTLQPLITATRATVLAGGTMQPLALTCGPLLPSPSPEAASPSAGEWLSQVTLISEGHVVPSSAIAVWTLGVGPGGGRMEFSHRALSQRSGDLAFPPSFPELATTLLNAMRVLPRGVGSICFFPSYDLEDHFTRYLQASGYYDRISEVVRIFRERGAATTDERSRYPQAGGSGAAVEGVLEAYKLWIQHQCSRGEEHDTAATTTTKSSGGALLFAVMGGRLSEGINFADDLGRAVFVVGLPYASPSDMELQLYLRHIATTCLGSTPAPASLAADSSGSGSTATAEWGLYTDLCMRTVNQCIGRCIRHAKDYAVVVLLDARYVARSDVRGRVSSWLQPSVRVASSFGECLRGIHGFFAEKKQQQMKKAEQSRGPIT